MAGLTFRSSKIIYYGPHECANCGRRVCKMGLEFGGNAFNYPDGPIYPNTEWHPHVCDPKDVAKQAQKKCNCDGVRQLCSACATIGTRPTQRLPDGNCLLCGVTDCKHLRPSTLHPVLSPDELNDEQRQMMAKGLKGAEYRRCECGDVYYTTNGQKRCGRL